MTARAHGFARARCGDCGHDFLIAFSCKGRGVCPSCTTRRMAQTAAHLTDHVFPCLPVRQWVLSVPKRLRYFMQRDGAVLGMVLRIFLRVIEQTLQAGSPGAASVDKAALHIGAVAFIHRFGSSLNEHVHFHVCAVDGVFESVAGEVGRVREGDDRQIAAPSVIFHPASSMGCEAVAHAQASLRKRILRAFVGLGLLEGFEAKEMLGYKHSGFSVDTSVCIAAQDRAGLERLLRYCARPPFALDRLRKAGSELVYRCAKQHSEPGSDRRGQRNAKRGAKHDAQADELHLAPLELIARLAALVPPPRSHRHRYYGVLAPNSPHRAAAVALAAGQTAGMGTGTGTAQPEPGGVPATTEVTAKAMGVATAGAPGSPPSQSGPSAQHTCCGRCSSHASTRCSRCCARSAADKRASSPSLHTAPTSDKYWGTSGWRQSHRASPQLAGHRCGTGAVRP